MGYLAQKLAIIKQHINREKQMKRFSILIVLLLAGCGESDHEALERMKGEEVERLVGEGKWELLLNGLTTITNEQAESLSKVQYLEISDSCQKLVDKYKKP